MILRRVIAHFKKQEWTAIALDFLIVVAGILLAFQITSWNDARRDRALEREYLERLHADIENTFESRARAAQWDETRLAQQALVLNALRTGALREEDRGAFDTGLAWFGFVSGPEVQWATFDELRSTGAMNLISDVALRSAILDFDADLQRRQGITENFMGSVYAFRGQLGGKYEVLNFTGERNDVELKYDFDALAADPAFLNTLSQIDMLSRFRLDMNQVVLADLAVLRDQIAGALEPGNASRMPAAHPAPVSETQIDPVAVSPDYYAVLFENEHLRAVEYALPPNAKDNPHTHPPKFTYALEGGTLLIAPDGGAPFESGVETGDGEWSPARGLHFTENIGDTTVRILLIEPKSATGSAE